MKKIFQKSIVAACDISVDTKLGMHHLAFKKPGDGISANQYNDILGRKASRNIKKNNKISMKDII